MKKPAHANVCKAVKAAEAVIRLMEADKAGLARAGAALRPVQAHAAAPAGAVLAEVQVKLNPQAKNAAAPIPVLRQGLAPQTVMAGPAAPGGLVKAKPVTLLPNRYYHKNAATAVRKAEP